MSSGLATLEVLKEPGTYETLETRSAALAEGLQAAAKAAGVLLVVNRVGSMLTPFFVRTGEAVTNFAQASACDTIAYAVFFNAMLDEGVFLAPSQYEAMFVGLAHDDDHIQRTITAAQAAMKAVKKGPPKTPRKAAG
jgi:glutamate-1-semialdehyde 2,1-aminomutase